MKLALFCLSAALAALGVFGWADKARAFDAASADHASAWALLAALDPLWPVFAVAAIGCIAAQVIAGCCTVNFARLAKAPKIWRAVAGAFYVVSVFFAAYSADMGAQIILGLPHRAAYETRERERAELTAEIAAINERLRLAGERLTFDPTATVAARQRTALATYQEVTRIDRARLPEAQRALGAAPPIARERVLAPWEQSVFLIFLLWAALEPWGYALAERGRVDLPGVKRTGRVPGKAPGPFETMLKGFGMGAARKAGALGQAARRAVETAAAAGAGLLVLGSATSAEATPLPAPSPLGGEAERASVAERTPASAAIERAARPSARLVAPTLDERPTRHQERVKARVMLREGMDLPAKEREARGLMPTQIAHLTGVPPGAIRRWGTEERRRRLKAAAA